MSLLIKGVQVVDGTGREPYKADVLVQKGLISSIGSLRGRGADKIVEGLGNYLAPGFIDVHARSDHSLSLFSNPTQDGFIGQGVTSIVVGQYGISLAPLIYGSLSLFGRWTDAGEININWHTTKELFSQIEKRNIGINWGTLAGYSTVRREIAGERKILDKKELAVIGRVLAEALKQGALGVSIDLDFLHGGYIASKEVGEIAKLTKSLNRVGVVGLRDNHKGLLRSIEEIVRVARATRAKIIIDHLKPTTGYTQEFKRALNLLKGELPKPSIRFLVNPCEISEVHISTFLPKSFQRTGLAKMRDLVADKKNKRPIEKEWRDLDLRSIRVASAPHHHYLVGKSLKNIAENWDISYIEALYKIMEMSEMRATVLYNDVNLAALRVSLAEEIAFITADDSGVSPGGGFTVNEAAHNAFPKFIKTALGEGLLSIEDVIKKITFAPAHYFGLEKVGLIEEGCAADLVLLGKDKYEVKQVILGGRTWGEEPLKGQALIKYR